MIDAENGAGWVGHLPSFEKQFPKVQGYLIKAIDKLIKRRNAADKIADLERVKAMVQNARSTDELMGAVRMGIEFTQDLIGK